MGVGTHQRGLRPSVMLERGVPSVNLSSTNVLSAYYVPPPNSARLGSNSALCHAVPLWGLEKKTTFPLIPPPPNRLN